MTATTWSDRKPANADRSQPFGRTLSASTQATNSQVDAPQPARLAHTTPFSSHRTTLAPCRRASSAVPSVDRLSTTMISKLQANISASRWIDWTQLPTFFSSLKHGTTNEMLNNCRSLWRARFSRQGPDDNIWDLCGLIHAAYCGFVSQVGRVKRRPEGRAAMDIASRLGRIAMFKIGDKAAFSFWEGARDVDRVRSQRPHHRRR